MSNRLMSNDLSREENRRSTEVSGFLSGEEKKKELCPTSWQASKSQSGIIFIISERGWFLDSRHKIKDITIEET